MIRNTAKMLLASLVCINSTVAEPDVASRGQVVLLHGLARSSASMKPLEKHLKGLGYETCNVSYPSTKYAIEVLAADYVLPSIRQCFPDADKPVSFVTHSLGGIIVRQLAHSDADLKFARVVMLAPPNHGSETVDKLGNQWLFQLINGPAGGQLSTRQDSVPNNLGPAPFAVGIITGDRSINLILSTMIKGENDGKVSIESARLEGMADFRVMPVSHPFIMKNHDVWDQVVYFLMHGVFADSVSRR